MLTEKTNAFEASFTYFQFLDATDFHTVAAFDESPDGDRVVPGWGCMQGSAADLVAKFQKLQASYAARGLITLHTTLNRCKDTGRKTKDIESCRVLCLDLDRSVTRNELKELVSNYGVHLVVESSPHRVHCYWKLQDGIAIESWKKYQLAIAHHFGGDKTLAQPAHIIRVPGFKRLTKQGDEFVPAIVWLADAAAPLSELALGERFPWLSAEYEAARAERRQRRNLPPAARINGHAGKVGEGRNSVLYESVFAAAAIEALTEEEAVAWALEFNELEFGTHIQGRLEAREVENTAKSAWRGAQERRERDMEAAAEREAGIVAKLERLTAVDTPGNGADKTTADTPQTERFQYDFSAPNFAAGRYDDRALVERVIQRFGCQLVRIGNHIDAYDDSNSVWRRQGQAEFIAQYVNDCIEDMIREPEFYQQFSEMKPDAAAKAEKRAIDRLRSNHIVLSTVQTVVKDNRIQRMTLEDFDQREELLHCPNGVLNMLTGEMRVAKATDYLLCRAGVPFNNPSGAAAVSEGCPGWLRFLEEIFAENDNPAGMVKFMQHMFGYTLGGSIEAQKIFVHFGGGANGKSKVIHALGLILGTYTARLECGALSKGKGSVARELNRLGASIEGKRAVLIDDLDVASTWNEGFVKSLTGPYLLSRKLYEEEVQLINRAKFHLGCNVAPRPEAENLGILRRLCIIPYNRTFEPDGTVERRLMRMLTAEASGILAWAVEGFREVFSGGELVIEYPAEVTESSRAYKQEHFTVETALERLFVAGSDNDPASAWFEIGEIGSRVRSQLPVGQEVPIHVLGTLLSKMKIPKKRVGPNSKKSTVYFLKFS